MADIQFEDDQYRSNNQNEQKSFFVRLVLATHIVSNDTQAQYVLLGIAILGVIITGVLFSMGGGAKSLSNSDIQRITQMQQDAQSPTQ